MTKSLHTFNPAVYSRFITRVSNVGETAIIRLW